MPYWLRVFCRTSVGPAPGEVLEALSSSKLPAQVDPEADVDLADPDWEQLLLVVSKEGGPLVVDRDVRGRGSFVDDEVDEFLERIADLPRSKAKTAVQAHLKTTKQVYALQVPTTSMDSEGWAIAHAVLRFLVSRCEGIAQADGEGFYEGNDVILELP
ncbi:MAG: hypothetical protein A3K66_06445 [Euryarchaeota archaeon RBG_16_67_27]|nr:MAG: hypothetical protein A3K66_06445 [Euryarchaeota archaeon RBG_16_67_27]